MDERTVEVLNNGSRIKKKTDSKRITKKKKRYVDTDPKLLHFKRPCRHNSKTFQCLNVTTSDIHVTRGRLYQSELKINQDKYLCRFLAVAGPNRIRRSYKEGIKSKPHSVYISYNFPITKKPIGCVPVCQKFFLAAFGVKRDRVINIAKIVAEGKFIKENRGGDRVSKKSESKKEAVRNFIRSFYAKESHYNRKKSCRIYLSSDLSISKLKKMYNAANDTKKVSYAMFRKVFLNDFNIGFSSPASDVCTFCLRTKNEISVEKDAKKKQILITERRVHKLRANAFYAHAKETPDNTATYCFDMQQVQPLPKTPIQEAFYARQLSFYALCIVNMQAKNPNFYVWSEEQAGRGACEVGSALLDHLCNLDFDDIFHLRLVCDGCGGQNRNAHIIHLLRYWLRHKAPQTLQDITIIFPVRGHSFLPADRVFGRVEKLLRKQPLITLKEEYVKLYSEVGKVKQLDKDWKLYDIKALQEQYQKIPGISEMKKIVIKRFKNQRTQLEECKIKTMTTYRFDTEDNIFKSLLKRGKHDDHVVLPELQTTHALKPEKKQDIETLLLKQFGAKWKELDKLQFYVNLLAVEGSSEPEEIVENESDCLHEEVALHI